MSRIYIASRLRNRSRCKEYREQLVADGHHVTSRWLDDVGGSYADVAARDLHDLRAASVLLLVSHVGRNGGMATELGVAIEREMRIIHLAAERGDLVFTHIPAVEYAHRFADVLDLLARRTVAA
jgi:hypothetical protein